MAIVFARRHAHDADVVEASALLAHLIAVFGIERVDIGTVPILGVESHEFFDRQVGAGS